VKDAWGVFAYLAIVGSVVTFLGERPTWLTVLGGGLILAGVILAMTQGSRLRAHGSQT